MKHSSHLKTIAIIVILWLLMLLEMLATLAPGVGIMINVIEEPTSLLDVFLIAIGSIMAHDLALGIAILTGFTISMCFVIRSSLSLCRSKSEQD